jgi:hypothetical protein
VGGIGKCGLAGEHGLVWPFRDLSHKAGNKNNTADYRNRFG